MLKEGIKELLCRGEWPGKRRIGKGEGEKRKGAVVEM